MRRVRSQDEAYTSERVFEDKPRHPKFDRLRQRNNRSKDRNSQKKQKKNEKKYFEIRDKSTKINSKMNENEKNDKVSHSKSNFIMRERSKTIK